MLAKKDEILIMPLGGLEQVGANCTMIGHDKEWIMVDLGIAFYDKYGIELLVPDISFPEKVKDKIKGLFITHAHEDHIGAIAHLWESLKCPIYVTEFPAAVLRQKFSEYDWKDEVRIHTIKQSERFKVGGFDIEYVPLAHSILGASGIYIKTSAGSLFHTGDWKVDETPLLGDRIDEDKMISLGKEGVDCLLCDSTNVLTNEEVGSESDVRETLIRLFKKYKDQRITVTCFASNLARMETILNVAKGSGRKIAVIGRSMHKMIEAVSKTKYFSKSFKSGLGAVVDEEEAMSMPVDKVLFLCTGSQGEMKSALYRIARGENRIVKLGKNDVVLFSSKVIPGNEVGIRDMQNLLVRKGVEIVTTETEEKIHVSGHPNRSALKKMYEWMNPKSLIPVHGDACMIYAHQRFAKENGIKETFIAESGDVVSLKNNGKLTKVHHYESELNAIDGNYIISLSDPSIKDRANMTYNGFVSVSFILGSSSKLSGTPDVEIKGMYVDSELLKKINTVVYQTVSNEVSMYSDDIGKMKDEISKSVKKIFVRYLGKRPSTAIHVHKI